MSAAIHAAMTTSTITADKTAPSTVGRRLGVHMNGPTRGRKRTGRSAARVTEADDVHVVAGPGQPRPHLAERLS